MTARVLGSFALTASLFCVQTALAQEGSLDACSNGIDDDGDGRTDLEDAGCTCSDGIDLFSRVVSVIPNPSFEDSLCCPSNVTQLHCADAWVQATGGTSDYLRAGCYEGHTGGIGVVPLPFPDGLSAVGTILTSPSYIEYVGACTTSPIEPGVEYTFELMVGAASSSNIYGGDTAGDLVLLGLRTCTLPLAGADSKEDDFDVLASHAVSLQGGGPYQRVTLTFTARNRYEGILIGPGQNMTIQSGQSGNYVVWDDLTLNSTSAFGSEISMDGDCDVGYELTGPAIDGVSYQWYRDSVAIPGATTQSYSVPLGESGVYSLRVDDGATCNMTSNTLAVECGICGDHMVDFGEECDDGAESADCNDDCTLARCGDGKHNAAAGEACDDGGESENCNADCTLAVCGDRIVNMTTGEECDEGEEMGSEFSVCSPECTLSSHCGDGEVDPDEECDDGGESARCNRNCTLSSCGDGMLNIVAEEKCDDRNSESGDGCYECQVEDGWHCSGTCCRDMDGDRICDDATTVATDAGVADGSRHRPRGGSCQCDMSDLANDRPNALAAVLLLGVLITRRRRTHRR